MTAFGSFADKINRYALPACTANNIQFHTIQNGVERSLMIPGEILQALYLIAKEAINNTNKYSAAENCSLTAAIHNNVFTLEIKDDGKGFDDAVNGTGNGLRNIQERTKDAGGGMVILNGQGRGTTIRVSLPFPFKIPDSRDRKQDSR